MPSLWPKQFDAGTLRTPLEILQEQGTALREATGGVVEGEVEQSFDASSNRFAVVFLLKPLKLSTYRWELLRLWHGAVLYPLRIFVVNGREVKVLAEDENQFIEILKELFSSDETGKIIKALMAQARGSTKAVKKG